MHSVIVFLSPITCNLRRYMPKEENAKITCRAELCFEWHIVITGFDERHCVQVCCRNANDRGVSLPRHWKTAMHCAKLQQIADTSAQELQDKTIANNIERVLLGVPKACGVPGRGVKGCIGSVAALKSDGVQRKEYI